MHILLSNEIGGIVEGVLLAAGRNVMRIALPGNGDALELRLSDGAWVAAAGERFELDAVIAGSDREMSSLGNTLRVQALVAGMQFFG
jgi:hypothetical protein